MSASLVCVGSEVVGLRFSSEISTGLIRIPSSLSSTTTFDGLSRPYFRAVSIGMMIVDYNLPDKNTCVIFLNLGMFDIRVRM